MVIQGQITMHLPQTSQYSIDAKAKVGDVVSDFQGSTKRKHFGHAFTQNAQAPHSLYLRIGFGDIILLQIQHPAPLR
jgi:hypothetical protein